MLRREEMLRDFVSFIVKYYVREVIIKSLTLSWRRSLSYRNQSNDLLCKLVHCFLYDSDLHHERVKKRCSHEHCNLSSRTKTQDSYNFYYCESFSVIFLSLLSCFLLRDNLQIPLLFLHNFSFHFITIFLKN